MINSNGEQRFYVPLSAVQAETLELTLLCNTQIIYDDPGSVLSFKILNLQLEL